MSGVFVETDGLSRFVKTNCTDQWSRCIDRF